MDGLHARGPSVARQGGRFWRYVAIFEDLVANDIARVSGLEITMGPAFTVFHLSDDYHDPRAAFVVPRSDAGAAAARSFVGELAAAGRINPTVVLETDLLAHEDYVSIVADGLARRRITAESTRGANAVPAVLEPSPLVRTADAPGLHPQPSSCHLDHHDAFCPGRSHTLTLDTSAQFFVCESQLLHGAHAHLHVCGHPVW